MTQSVKYQENRRTTIGTLKSSNIIILMPAFNEENTIEKVIADIRHNTRDIDILVVDDGSKDKTSEKAKKTGAIVIRHIYNMGYGAALQTGFKYALKKNYDYAIQVDADGQHDPKSIHNLLSVVTNNEADVALGSRFLGQKNYTPTFAKKLGMIFFSIIATIFTGNKVTDPTSGFQALNKKVIELYASQLYPVDYPDADVLIMLYKMGYRVKEVPVVMYSSTSSQSMHSGLKPLYYVFKMSLSIFVTLLRKYK